MKTWGILLWSICVTLFLIIIGILGYLIAMYISCGFIWVYVIGLAVIILTFVIVTLYLKKTHNLHIHHYTIGMILIVMLGY